MDSQENNKMRVVPGRAALTASISTHGHRVDELKSWMQKALRQGREDEARYCALELYLFRGLDGGQRIVSNLLNRLLLIGVEDVGGAEPRLPTKALCLYHDARDKPVDGRGTEALVEWIALLVRCRKVRALSDLGLYWRPHKAEWALNQPELDDLFALHNVSVANLRATIRGREPTDMALIDCFDGFVSLVKGGMGDWHGMPMAAQRLLCLIELGSNLAFYYCARDFCYATTKLRPSMCGRTKPVHLAWAMLIEYAKRRCPVYTHSEIASLREMFEQRQGNADAPLFLYQALQHCVWRDRLEPDRALPKTTLDFIFTHELQLPKHLARPALQIPTAALDKHTKRGREQGKTGADFVLEGATVANEWQKGVDPRLRRLYLQLATELEKGTEPLTVHPWTGQGPVRNWPRYRDLNHEEVGEDQPARKRQKISANELRQGVDEVCAMKVGDPRIQAVVDTIIETASPYLSTEAEAFEWPQRIQVLTSRSKPDTYYALDRETTRPLFVKGPYLSKARLQFQLDLNACKSNYAGVTPVPDMEVRWLVPDPAFLGGRKNPEGFGTRTKLVPGRAYPFLVCADIKCPRRDAPYPQRPYGKEGGKWPADTMLAFTDQSGGAQHVRLRTMEHIYMSRAELGVLAAVLFRYVWRVTDTCERNLMWNVGTDLVYSVDEESSGGTEQDAHLFKKPLGHDAKRSMTTLLKRHWDFIRKMHLKTWYLVRDQPDWVRANIRHLIQGGLEGALKLL